MLDDLLAWLSLVVELPVPDGIVIRGIEDRLIEERVRHLLLGFHFLCFDRSCFHLTRPKSEGQAQDWRII